MAVAEVQGGNGKLDAASSRYLRIICLKNYLLMSEIAQTFRTVSRF
jgi:hypothetical protein